MSNKILLPLAALAVCPLVLLATQSKKPDEASADSALAGASQKPKTESATTQVSNLGTVRPGSPQSLIERSRLARSADPAVTADSELESVPLIQSSVPTISLERITIASDASLEQIVARSFTPIRPSSLSSHPANSLSTDPETIQEAIGTIATPSALPQIPQPAAMPDAIVAPPAMPETPDIRTPQPLDFLVGTSLVPIQAALINQAVEPTPHVESKPQDQYSAAMLEGIASVLPTRPSSSIAEARQIDSAVSQPIANLKKASFSTSEKLAVRAAYIHKVEALPATASVEASQPPTHPSITVSPAVTVATDPAASVQPAAPHSAAPQTAATQTATSQPSVIGETYTLGAGDRISVSFFNVSDYNGEYQVAADGSVNLPVVGGASLKGLTLQEASSFIASLYKTELAHPRVTVNLVNRRPLQVSIIGEVGQPGLYTLAADQSAQVIQAIQAAGGFTQSANLRQVQIRRSFRGQTQTIAVNVRNLLENGDLTQNLTLQDGDSLYIPAANAVDLAESGQLASSNLATSASTQLKIALVGEVNHPGAYQLPNAAGARATLTQAIQMAGGITPTADVRQVQIRRTTHMGDTQTINVNLWQLLQSGDLKQDLILQNGDTIVLAKAEQMPPAESLQLASTNLSPGEIQVNLTGEVKTPGSLKLPSNVTLNQAILQTGGLNARARRSAQLIRVSPTGTLSRRTIHLDFNQDANAESNPVLQNNDLVVVGRSTTTQIADGISNFLAPILRVLPPFQSLF